MKNNLLFAPLPLSLLSRPELSPGAKLAYARLRLFAGNGNQAFPSLTTLGRELGQSRRQAARYVGELKRAKLIASVHRPGRETNIYRFMPHSWTGDINGTSDVSGTSDRYGIGLVTDTAPALVTDMAYRKDISEKRYEKRSLSRESEIQFDYFWRMYPRKEGKPSAKIAFETAYAEHEANPSINRKLMGLIEEALDWQKELDEWQRDDGRWIPKPTNYLRDKRWLDERPRTNDADEHAKGF